MGRRGDGEVHYDEAPQRLGADSSPPKHFSSHQSHHEGREACSSSLYTTSFFPSLSSSVLVRPWATVPFSHTPAGRTQWPALSIIPRVSRYNKKTTPFGCSLNGGFLVLRRACENLMSTVLFSIWTNHVRSMYVIMDIE